MHLWRRLRHSVIDEKSLWKELQWLDESEMLDITAITQSSPGLSRSISVIIGYRMGGILGSLTAILGTIIPPDADYFRYLIVFTQSSH